MKTKRFLALFLALMMTASLFAFPAGAAEFDPIFVTSNGVTSTGSFNSLFSGQIGRAHV